jgi:hypothetical protein
VPPQHWSSDFASRPFRSRSATRFGKSKPLALVSVLWTFAPFASGNTVHERRRYRFNLTCGVGDADQPGTACTLPTKSTWMQHANCSMRPLPRPTPQTRATPIVGSALEARVLSPRLVILEQLIHECVHVGKDRLNRIGRRRDAIRCSIQRVVEFYRRPK